MVVAILGAVERQAVEAQAVKPAAVRAVPSVLFEKREGALRKLQSIVAQTDPAGVGEDEDLPGLHPHAGIVLAARPAVRSEEHTSELQSLMRISYAVFCLKKKNNTNSTQKTQSQNNR